MNFTATIEKFEKNLWDYHFIVPEEIATRYWNELKTRRVICTFNESLKIHCALHSTGLGEYYIILNKANRKIISANLGSEIKVLLEEDKSKYGIHCPEEMKELQCLDYEGEQLFHQLSPGKQRSLLHIVGKIKSSDLRIRKSMVILDYLKENNGALDFKELNEAFKVANSRY